jgi:hypothetical protein
MRRSHVCVQLDSVFRVLEPVVGKINERAKAPVSLSSRLGLRQPRSEWFRIYRVRLPHFSVTGILKLMPYDRTFSFPQSPMISSS